MRALFFAVASAACRGLAQPGWVGWPLLLLAVPLRLLGWNAPARRPALADLAHGFVFWLFAFSFLSAIHPIAVPAAAALMSLLGPIEGFVARRLRRWLPAPAAGALALAATGWLQAEWFLIGAGGVPWASWAWPLAESPLLPLASSLGESGIVALVCFAGAALAAPLLKARRDPSFLVALLLAGAGLAAVAPVPEPSGAQPCLAVQGCVRVEDKARVHLDADWMYQHQAQITVPALARLEAPCLVLWAETMWPYPAMDPAASPGLLRQWFPGLGHVEDSSDRVLGDQRFAVLKLLQEAPEGSLFATGAHLYRPLPENADEHALAPRSSETVVFDQAGALRGHLPKSELVPFGERLPLGGRFPFARRLADLIQTGSGLRPDFVRPPGEGPLRVEGLPALGFVTCWENVFARAFRVQAQAGAEAFIVLSNEDWYGDGSREMTQMIAATRLRAVETRRHVLRVTNTGWTGLVGADGGFRAGPEIGRPEAWDVPLPLVPPSTRTAYLRFGHAILPILAALAAILALAPRRTPSPRLDHLGRAG